MIQIIVDGGAPQEALSLANQRLKANSEELLMPLEANPALEDRSILKGLLSQVNYFEYKVVRTDKYS
ncbi:MAG: hypothetical protein LBT47_04095 [Deltaproteobacteria bacterium]|jgi:hypothetical protein|nr:hypothetical protein [Deltaproteobacteria bacterium]